MKRNLIFVSVLLFLFAGFVFSHYSIWWLFLLVTWLGRLIVKQNAPLLIGAMLLCLLFFIRHYSFYQENSILLNEEATVVIQAKLTTVSVDGSRLSFQGLVTSEGQQEEVMVRHTFSTEREKQLFITNKKDTFMIDGAVSDPNQATNFFQFDYKDYLNKKRIYKVLEAEKLTPIENEQIDRPLFYKIDSIRQNVLSFIDARYSTQAAMYTKALLFADKRDFNEPVSASFRELGIVHLLSISGLHIHFLIDSLKKGLNKLSVTKETSQWILFTLLPLYGFLTGFGVSVFRAIGQSWLRVFGEMTRFKLTTLDSWCIVFCASLLINPFNLLNVGFQLSYFISLLIILLVNQPFYKAYNSVKAYIVLSVIVFIGSLPILSYHFFEFSWGVVFLNSLYIPFLSILFLPMLVLLFLISIFFYDTRLFSVCLKVAEAMITLMEETTLFISRHTSFSVVTGRLPVMALTSLVVSFIVLLLMIERKQIKRSLYILPTIVTIISVFSVRYSPYGNVMMIDVGQGESILIKEPWGKGNYLIDTGGLVNWRTEDHWELRESAFNLGEDTVVPVLKSHGIHQMDTVIITHADWDHYGALDDIAKHLPINTLLATESTLKNPVFLSSLEYLLSTDTEIRSVENQPEDALPKEMRALYPLNQTHVNTNNDSLILLGKIGDYTWLFTGDLEKEGEESLVNMYPNLKVDVLKVGHHGSNTSTYDYLLDNLSPNYAWISAGRYNSYGHPHPDVMERLQKKHIQVFQTNSQGAIQYIYTDSWVFDLFLNRTSLFQTKTNEKE